MRSRSKLALRLRLALAPAMAMAMSFFAASAHGAITCTVTLPDIDFGAVNATEQRAKVNPQLSISCSGGAANGSLGYTVHLNYSGVMQGVGADVIPYGLYKDSARTLPWNTSGTSDVLSFNAAGVSRANAASRMTIHAEVRGFDFRDVAPGSYQDTITATLEY